MKKRITSKLLNISLLLFAITSPLFLGGCIGAGTPTSVDITGTWTVSTTGTGGTNGIYTLTSINNQVGGSAPGGQSIGGTITGSSIQFNFVDTSGATETYTGTVTTSSNGTLAMNGNFSTTSNGSGDWVATENSSTTVVSLTGTWTLSSTQTAPTTAAAVTQTIMLTMTGSTAFTGTTQAGQTISGTINGFNVSFSWTDSAGTNTYLGTIATTQTSMSGTYNITTNGTSTASGTWTATD